MMNPGFLTVLSCVVLLASAANAEDVAIVNESGDAIESITAEEVADPTQQSAPDVVDVEITAPAPQAVQGEGEVIPEDAIIADVGTNECVVDLSVDMANGETRDIANLDTCSVSVIIVEESNEVIEPVESTVE